MNVCAYCLDKVKEKCDSFLVCSKCNKNVHLNCLKSGAVLGGLLGDVFFNFECQECSPTRREEISRQRLSWINLIVLALYNLHKQAEGISQRGYFHWRIHICSFIEKHWNILCGNSVKKKKNWLGTVSGTLSHYSPTYFRSGFEELRESGWWRLAHSLTPRQIMELHSRSSLEKKKAITVKPSSGNLVFSSAPSSPARNTPSPSVASSKGLQAGLDESSLSAFDETSSVELNNIESEQEVGTPSSSGRVSTTGSFSGWSLLKASENMYSRAYVEPSETLSDCLFADDDEDNCTDMDVDIEEVESLDFCYPRTQSFRDIDDFLHPAASFSASSSDTGQFAPVVEELNADEEHNSVFDTEDKAMIDSEVNKKKEVLAEGLEIGLDDHGSEIGDEQSGPIEPVPKSLFSGKSKEKKPWEVSENKEIREGLGARCLPMSVYEELHLLNQLRRFPHKNELTGSARRLYRKLCVRRLKRERNMPLFNLDNTLVFNKYLGQHESVWSKPSKAVGYGMEDVRILDRFQHVAKLPEGKSKPQNCSFIYRLMGHSEPNCFYSPYTQRLLKPYIRRDYETMPLWLKLMQDIQVKANKNDPNWILPKRCPIDYSYVRPQHIPTINSLCSEFFYPGIDVTECLQYPDFSCVALYKKLIIGFAFMVPDVGYNEAYISFLFTRQEWRRAGIGSFMLYHLIQTCMGSDVTLHVSATNPALILYQKFGFKVEEFVLDFYDKYFPIDSKECKHALFLRLSR
ncbi:cysteine-rich protein 2-binding protein [Anabrus simplex]|uniref:cysteine-rich protein 2-binding protein n=1 Tax=Anabrus simplex TaxID=316456 RepID=UPI0035A2A89C